MEDKAAIQLLSEALGIPVEVVTEEKNFKAGKRTSGDKIERRTIGEMAEQ